MCFRTYFSRFNLPSSGWLFLLLALMPGFALAATPRETIAAAALAEEAAKQKELLASLVGQGDDAIAPLLTAWRQDALYLYAPAEAA